MSLEINIQELPEYIRVEVSGSRTRGKEMEEAVDLWKQVVEVCQASGRDRILFITMATGRIPTLEAYEVAGHPEDFGWSRGYKMALVDLNPESLEDNQFAGTVAVNRGFNVKIFDNEKEGEIWLLVT